LKVDTHYNYFQWVDEVKPQIETIPHTKELIPTISILQAPEWYKVWTKEKNQFRVIV